ncbi:unnamed protein product [Mytilus coruscus]|uniref:Uncharacterized protein n=1 Tax=Mytilus coruscus TaxID=42192 RepID=A0A6J8ATU4_MYTCO|nr:unnamed protein product [Mytilus coruscus]
MEIARRRSDRVKTKRSAYTPAKPACKAVIVASTNEKSPKVNTTDHSAGYTLNKNKAIRPKLDASNRTCSVVPEFSPGNLVLTFTADFYNTSSKVVLNGNHLHMSVFISSTLPDILNVLDNNKVFITINSKISQCCTAYLNSNQASCTRSTDINISIHQDQCQNSKHNGASTSLKSLINASDNKDQQQNDYCPTCENLCSSDDKAVECEICNRWLHYECEKLTVKEVAEIENNLTLEYKLSISATPTTTCNNTNILEEEIKDLKSQLGLKDKQLKTKESLICKQDSEIKLMQKELATNRALTIQLEQDKKDLEHSLLIQQKPSNTVHEPSAFNREDNSRSYAMEQRVRSLEFELLKQDNKISNLSDKFIDFKIEHDRKQQRTRKNKQKVSNKHSAD